MDKQDGPRSLVGGTGKMSGKGRANPGARSETGKPEALWPSRRAVFRI